MTSDTPDLQALQDGKEITLSITLSYDGDGYTARIGSVSAYAAGIGPATSTVLTKLKAEYERATKQQRAVERQRHSVQAAGGNTVSQYALLGKHSLDLTRYEAEYDMAVRFANGESHRAIGATYPLTGSAISQRLTRYQRIVRHHVRRIAESPRLSSDDRAELLAWMSSTESEDGNAHRSQFQVLVATLKPA